jgi:hypothetical protein
MEKELNECRGCTGLIKRDDVDLPDPVAHMYFNEGEWNSVCSLTPIRTRVFKECPCWECLIRPICCTICESLHEVIQKNGLFISTNRVLGPCKSRLIKWKLNVLSS